MWGLDHGTWSILVHAFPAADTGTDWNHRFDDAVRDLVTTEPSEVLRLADNADYRRAVPTPDHYWPLLYIAGLASAAGRPMELMLEGYAAGSLSMTSYTLGATL